MLLVSPLTPPLLLLLLVGRYSCTLVSEVAVVSPPADVGMRVVAASLGTKLSANRRRGLIGCSSGARLLDGSQSTFSYAVRWSITPGPFGRILLLQWLLLPQGGR